MPSSLIFAALAAAWLVVLVPMVAKRRQEVVRIAESALASRVLNRQGTYRAALQYDQEVAMLDEGEGEAAPDERRYRPGRGGYDPEAAELAARERYVFRQRVVLGLLIGVVITLVLGFVSSGLVWWMHAALVGALVGYLGYRRRQVRIEQDVRNRRAARMAGSRGLAPPAVQISPQDELDAERGPQEPAEHTPQQYRQPARELEQPGHAQPGRDRQSSEQPVYEESSEVAAPSVRHPASRPPVAHPTAVALDLDDDDPMFDELDPAFEPPYRRAAGE
ncbi:MAG: gephyrin-like molybdotransferase receptor GlpR [Pseudonocardiaceae bacterium]